MAPRRQLAITTACLAFLLLIDSAAHSQDPAPADDAPAPEDVSGRLERLERQNQRLERQNQRLLQMFRQRSADGQSAPDASDGGEGGPGPEAPASGESRSGSTGGGSRGEGPAPEGREGEPGTGAPGSGGSQAYEDRPLQTEWSQVGKNLNMKAQWINFQPWLESAHGTFRVHVGGRVQPDLIWSTAPRNVEFGNGGTGRFYDAVNFRRLRFEVDGWFYEMFDYFVEVDFVNSANVDPTAVATSTNVDNVPVPTEVWASSNYLPWIGTFRIGNQKNPIGLEHMISSRYLDFLERASYFDTFLNRNNGMQPGIMILNWTRDERVNWQIGVFKNDQTPFAWNVSPGAAEFNAHITAIPWYEFNGRYMIHLGLGYQYDDPQDNTANFRDRFLLRNGPSTLQTPIAFAVVNGHHQQMFVPEFFMNLGPLSIMAEYLGTHMDQVAAFATPTQKVTVPGANKAYYAQSAYVQAMYFLTGENRPYYRTALHSSGAAPTRIVPNRNFFWLPGQGRGRNPFSSGAWQVGIRYSWTDLTSNGIYGGEENQVTLGLNWFLTPNMKLQFNYVAGRRWNLGPTSTSNGPFNGFGSRLAFDW